jgi:putative hemolysin
VKKQAIILALFYFLLTASALKNPAVVYCTSLGYEYMIKNSSLGDAGICKFAQREACSAWDFVSGYCGAEHGYCNRTGYSQRIGSGRECGSEDRYARCALCILENGSTVEVTELMNLSFKEAICGDGICDESENIRTCRKDCIGKMREVKIEDIGSPVTTEQNGPEKENVNSDYSVYVILISVTGLAALFRYLSKRKKNGRVKNPESNLPV